jgi:hypothetical protein
VEDLTLKKKKIKKIALIIGALIGCIIIAPIIGMLIQGMVGLVVAGIVALITIQLAPWFADVIANWRLKLIKHEASKNPVETLQNDFIKRQAALASFAEAITNFATAIKNFNDKLAGFKKQWTDEEATKFTEQLDKMKQLLELRRRKYSEAEQALQEYSIQIKKAESIWIMGQEAAKMTAAAGMTDEDFLQKLKVDTALDSVSSTMNRAFAELETSLMEEKKETIDTILDRVDYPKGASR